MDDRIKELLGEERAKISVIKISEVNFFLNLKRNNIESLRKYFQEDEDEDLVTNFWNF